MCSRTWPGLQFHMCCLHTRIGTSKSRHYMCLHSNRSHRHRGRPSCSRTWPRLLKGRGSSKSEAVSWEAVLVRVTNLHRRWCYNVNTREYVRMSRIVAIDPIGQALSLETKTRYRCRHPVSALGSDRYCWGPVAPRTAPEERWSCVRPRVARIRLQRARVAPKVVVYGR